MPSPNSIIGWSRCGRLARSWPILLLVAGCVTASPAVDSFCSIYAPVFTIKSDSELTKRQVDHNNAAWVRVCDRPKG